LISAEEGRREKEIENSFYNHTSQVAALSVLLLILARLNRSRFEAVLVCRPPDNCKKKRGFGHSVRRCGAVERTFTWRIRHADSVFRILWFDDSSVRARVASISPT